MLPSLMGLCCQDWNGVVLPRLDWHRLLRMEWNAGQDRGRAGQVGMEWNGLEQIKIIEYYRIE